jgi:hypothetical protein
VTEARAARAFAGRAKLNVSKKPECRYFARRNLFYDQLCGAVFFLVFFGLAMCEVRCYAEPLAEMRKSSHALIRDVKHISVIVGRLTDVMAMLDALFVWTDGPRDLLSESALRQCDYVAAELTAIARRGVSPALSELPPFGSWSGANESFGSHVMATCGLLARSSEIDGFDYLLGRAYFFLEHLEHRVAGAPVRLRGGAVRGEH